MHQKIVKHFQKSDPLLYAILKRIKPIEILTKSDDFFADLCEAIINQQLSDKAAATIFARFKKLFPKEKITPEELLKLADGEIRKAGTSGAKVKFMKNLAQRVIDREILLDKMDKLSNELVIKELTKVKGIGPWTAEMFLMFSLGREDVFSYGDLGLKKAIQKLYNFKKEPTRRQMEKLVKRWSPYKTYAARILWRSISL